MDNRSNNLFDHDHSKVVVEDTPHLRSVAIGALSHAPQALSFDAVPAFPSAKPFATTRVDVKTGPGPTTTAPVEQGWPGVVAEPMPQYYCLERTHATIQGCSAELLAKRIAECFRVDSIAATFSANEAVAETADCVSFSVRLWSEHDSRIIVEVQRISGCGFVYQQTARNVLRACNGEALEGHDTDHHFKLPSCLPQETAEAREKCIQHGLEVAQSLLNEDKMDTQLMALESLVMISGACPAARVMAARRIVSDEYPFLAELKSLIETGRLVPDRRDVRPTSDMEVEHLATLRRHALHVLANCIAALDEAGALDVKGNPYGDALCSDRLVASLVQVVASCESCPHNASLALRSLRALCRSSAEACTKVHGALQERGGVLAAAQLYGSRRHAQLLEQATAMNVQLQQQHRDH